ncbi:MSHA biogenesis protein MshI [Shewanella benthica]|uniref:MSHA biogenesis protein MshI n=1 Tax=Shewanella benthica TaxID=43661 RepID=UPI0018796EEF|nr:MSHA biogenesis protein MshI [Shewanella benthica]MBE7214437.1 MSHA biogenesis protein MshI [Shewanella benthica]MCL1061503.1 MSHA biogenesis protein MshI [Shewanella benthica]
MEKSLLTRLAFWKNKQSKLELGIYVCPDKLVVYQAKHPDVSSSIETESHVDESVETDSITHEFAFNGSNWSGVFASIAKQFKPAKLHITLSASFYQLLVVDKPNVEPSEMSQALLWSVKDMVTHAVTDIHLDYFDSPLPNSAKLNVVVAEKARLSAMVLAAQEHHMQVLGISIEEMAVTSLFAKDNQAKLVLCHTPGQDLLLTVVKQGQLYMQRRVRGFNKLDTVSADDLAMGMADSLSLELQRSMDYFESQLRQAPVASIELLINGQVDKLAELVSANFDQKVNAIPVDTVETKIALLTCGEFHRVESREAGVQV